jgi:SAM-dependent methyltransferase
MAARDAAEASAIEIATVNHHFYDSLWTAARFIPPERFNTWPLVCELVAASSARLEIGPGLRPRLPLAGTEFLDLSEPAVAELTRRGGNARVGSILALPHPDQAFDLICAFDILEHVEDDETAVAELRRVLRPGGTLLFSVPLYRAAWTELDAVAGHYRRYEPCNLEALLSARGFTIQRSAVYGMQPKSTRLLRWGLWWLKHHPSFAMSWFNGWWMPLGLWLQKPLVFAPGLSAAAGVDEIIAVATLSS